MNLYLILRNVRGQDTLGHALVYENRVDAKRIADRLQERNSVVGVDYYYVKRLSNLLSEEEEREQTKKEKRLEARVKALEAQVERGKKRNEQYRQTIDLYREKLNRI